MNTATTLLGFEVGFWPALVLLPVLMLFAALLSFGLVSIRREGVAKTWSGRGESNFLSRTRMFLPALFLFVGTSAVVLALADITHSYVVVEETYKKNRLYINVDNSGSMWNWFDARERNGIPIHCTCPRDYSQRDPQPVCPNNGLKNRYPRIFNACRALFRIADATEAYSKKKGDRDEISLLRFGLHSFVEFPGTTDYERVRRGFGDLNWRDDRTGIFTEIHIALWDTFQVALQRNFRGDPGLQAKLDEADRLTLYRSFRPEGLRVRYHVPQKLRDKLILLREDLRDTAFIFITDAHEGQLDQRLDKDPSLVKMMQLAEFLEFPIYVISIYIDHEPVRKLAEKTGYGPMGGQNRGAFYLLKGEKNFQDIDEIMDKILSTRFRVVSTVTSTKRVPYTSFFVLIAIGCLSLGFILEHTLGRTITKGGLE